MHALGEVRLELSLHRNDSERDLRKLVKLADNLESRIRWMERSLDRSPVEGVQDLKQALEGDVSRIRTELTRLVDQVADGPSMTNAALRAYQDATLSRLDDARDETIAAITRSFKAALPDLNRRFRDAQAVLIRLDRQLRLIISDHDVPVGVRIAIVGQLDDHMRDAEIRVHVVDGEPRYHDASTDEEL